MIETKVNGSTIGTVLPSVGLALLNALAADSSMLGGLHPFLQFVVIAIIPPLITFLSGYVTPSRTSNVSDIYNVRSTE
jgi:hypothetical protein